MFGFFKRESKKRSGSSTSARPASRLPLIEHHRTPPCQGATPHLAGKDTSSNPGGGCPRHPRIDDEAGIADLADRISEHLAPLFEPLPREENNGIASLLRENQAAFENHVTGLGKGIREGLERSMEERGRRLQELIARCIKPLADRITKAVEKDCEAHWSTLRKELLEACSTTAQRAAQRPTIDQLIALLDRIRRERSFLTAWYGKDPGLSLDLGCRQLQERYDAAIGSFAVEVLMILRALGVEEIQGSSGPFRPQCQQILDVETTSRLELDGHVARIVRAGFLWNGAVYRPEQVIVFKKERKNDEEKVH